MKKLLFTLSCFYSFFAVAQPVSLDASLIPDSIKKNAAVVKRYENMSFEVNDLDRTDLEVKQIYTLMNDHAKSMLTFREYTSKYVILDDVEIKVYDERGKQIGRYKKKDLSTQGIGEGLVEDGMLNYLTIAAPSYPFTIEFRYHEHFKGTLFFPEYNICGSSEGVENSTFIAKIPKDLDLRFKAYNVNLQPQQNEDGKYKVYQWSVKNLPPIEYEEGAALEKRYPMIALAPNKFSYYGHEGDFSSWNNYGKWMAGLYQGLDVLPEDRKQFFRNLVKDAPNDTEKAKLIYNYLQKNFRYVSIQLGLGGLRPFSADFTDKNKYGDCKALSNYMRAALATVGIRSHVAIINAEYNREPVETDFPRASFNHVILCIPRQKDSIWLECTSSTADFGRLGSFTENRNALLITENGGVLVPTPRSKAADNVFYSTATVQLQDDGSGKTISIIRGSGEFKRVLDYMMKEKDDDKKEILVNYWGFKQPDDFSIQENDSRNDLLLNMEMNFSKIPEFKAGNKMFLSPRMYKLWLSGLPTSDKRRLDYFFRNPFEKTDTTIFKLPEGYIADALPQAKAIKCEFGTYSTRYWFDESTRSIYSSARLELSQNRIPAAKYESVKSFFDEVLTDNSQRIVIKKN